ncbi:MAG TPA: alkaline phosphatase family protein [Candidatus Saccharimonadales bacterium]|nr:alkaline phosphatase family protein [Candidatus Saccharimonadales bacterium]
MPRPTRVSRRWVLIGAAGVGLFADAIARRRSVRGTSKPGLLIVQIDGLGLPALQCAIDGGHAPFIDGLLSRGEATIDPWFAMVPPTTPASQAGIMHGRNDDIPGFRWYEKKERRLLVANHSGDAAEIVRRQSDGQGLLAPDGASIGNLMTGDARRTYLTMATVAEEPRAPGTLIRLRTFLLSPLNSLRIVAGMAREFAAEVYQGERQKVLNVRPRMHRGFDSATERAFLNGAVRVLSTELVMAEMRMGTPVIYVDYTGYDAIAHHSGPERPESLRAVRGIDSAIERILASIPRARRPYRLVVLSDHGQSLGQPFGERYGQSLEQFVASAMGDHISVQTSQDTEHNQSVGVIARELGGIFGIGPAIIDAVGQVARRIGRRTDPTTDKRDLVVCASGNLAHLYFPICDDRMTIEEIERRYPGLMARLLDHPAVGCVLVRSSVDGALAINRAGRRRLDQDELVGEDPLSPFGPLAASSLQRLDGFSNVGDVVLLSTVDPSTQEVISFEPLVGCHGGLGGAQSEPFIVYPSDWKPARTPLVGAPAVYEQLREWLAESQA